MAKSIFLVGFGGTFHPPKWDLVGHFTLQSGTWWDILPKVGHPTQGGTTCISDKSIL